MGETAPHRGSSSRSVLPLHSTPFFAVTLRTLVSTSGSLPTRACSWVPREQGNYISRPQVEARLFLFPLFCICLTICSHPGEEGSHNNHHLVIFMHLLRIGLGQPTPLTSLCFDLNIINNLPLLVVPMMIYCCLLSLVLI